MNYYFIFNPCQQLVVSTNLCSVMKNIPLLVLGLMVAFSVQLMAAGITGRVTDSRDRGQKKVRVTIKYGDQTNYTYTDSNGDYTIEVPAAYAGSKGKVYASGTYVTACTIRAKGYNRVNVKVK